MPQAPFLISVQKAGNKILAEYQALDLDHAMREAKRLLPEFLGEADRVAVFEKNGADWRLVRCWRYALESDSWLACDPPSDPINRSDTD